MAVAELHRLGLIPEGEPQTLGGSMGIVFMGRDPGRVVKLTDDAAELSIMRHVVGKEHRGICRVFSISPIRVESGPAFAVEMERLYPLSDSEERKARTALLYGGYDSTVPMKPEHAMQAARVDPRIGPLAKACATLHINPDLHGDQNIMAAEDGTWTLADLGPPWPDQDFSDLRRSKEQ